MSHIFKFCSDIPQTFHKFWREYAAFAVDDHTEGMILWNGVLIYSFVGQGIVYIGNGDDLCGKRDFRSPQAVRVTASIISLVMGVADFLADL